jgi:hypothetical protein
MSGWSNKGGSGGSQGPQGIPGVAGTIWYSGSGAPTGATGVHNDRYLNTANGDVHKNTSGVWSLVGNIQGPQGPQGPAGTGTGGASVYKNIKDYGTFGTTAATEAAFAAAAAAVPASGGTLFIPAGLYPVNNVAITKDNLTILAEKGAVITSNFVPATHDIPILRLTGSNNVIRDLTVYYTNTTNTTNANGAMTRNGIEVHGRNILVENCEAKYLPWAGLACGGSNTSSVTFLNCYSHHNGEAGVQCGMTAAEQPGSTSISGYPEDITVLAGVFNYNGGQTRSYWGPNAHAYGVSLDVISGKCIGATANYNNGRGVDSHYAVESIQFSNNYCKGNELTTGPGIDNDACGIQVTRSALNTVITGNTVKDMPNYAESNGIIVGGQPDYSDGIPNILIANNIVENVINAGIYARPYKTDSCIISNNNLKNTIGLFVQPNGVLDANSSAKNLLISNNIITKSTGVTYLKVLSAQQGDFISITSNVIDTLVLTFDTGKTGKYKINGNNLKSAMQITAPGSVGDTTNN